MFFSLSPFSLIKKRNQLFLTAACSVFVTLSSSVAAMAQVSVNQSALNSLGDAHKTKSKEIKKTSKQPEKKRRTQSQKKKVATPDAKPQPAAAKPVVLPTIPPAPPPVPVFKDANLVVPLHPPAPPPMPKVVNEAKGEVRATKLHTLLIFDDNGTDLNESMMKAIMDYANMLKQHPNATVYLNAYSHGNADDLSTPRRVALNRGLAIRAVLINQGIPSTRIYLLAKGIPDTQVKDLSPDHVEMIRSDLMVKPKAVTQPQK
ncbi:hypothetical protein CIN_05170 [Commensalibacter intestini A911]|uniref:OmpA-like domain-containing protein n=1 Tax=Commensalibacter intestini A911 TaxID=1088868 RepID=G6EYJ7_9PROT|nr:OmpA family protein [Commensalibacter intestini]EHD14585.1 hypothetical protein CIN_05170 [Commensalibacter intestini A911]